MTIASHLPLSTFLLVHSPFPSLLFLNTPEYCCLRAFAPTFPSAWDVLPSNVHWATSLTSLESLLSCQHFHVASSTNPTQNLNVFILFLLPHCIGF